MGNNTTGYTVHAVLAGCYKGRNRKAGEMLTHASLGDDTAICGRVQEGGLCDLEEAELTCPVCIKKVARLGLARKQG